jgi:hypothetical protein
MRRQKFAGIGLILEDMVYSHIVLSNDRGIEALQERSVIVNILLREFASRLALVADVATVLHKLSEASCENDQALAAEYLKHVGIFQPTLVVAVR